MLQNITMIIYPGKLVAGGNIYFCRYERQVMVIIWEQCICFHFSTLFSHERVNYFLLTLPIRKDEEPSDCFKSIRLTCDQFKKIINAVRNCFAASAERDIALKITIFRRINLNFLY